MDRFTTTKPQYHAAPRKQTTQGNDEGWDVKVRGQTTLYGADGKSYTNACRERGDQPPAEPPLSYRRDTARETNNGTNGKVDLPSDNDHQHSHCKYARHCGLAH